MSDHSEYIWLMRQAVILATGVSLDHSTKLGAIIVRPDGPLTMQVNAPPPGVRMRPDRPAKYTYTEHAERNAIFKSAAEGLATAGATMICPWAACVDCARAIACARISKLVRLKSLCGEGCPEHWRESVMKGNIILAEGGVEVIDLEGPIGLTLLVNGALVNV